MATKTRTGSRASRTRAPNPARPPVTEPVDRDYAGKVTVTRTRVDVPMLVLRGGWLKSHRLPDRREGISSGLTSRATSRFCAWASSSRGDCVC